LSKIAEHLFGRELARPSPLLPVDAINMAGGRD
jgi:hypothetical protein